LAVAGLLAGTHGAHGSQEAIARKEYRRIPKLPMQALGVLARLMTGCVRLETGGTV
jgi:hypothetical protein